MGDLRGAVGLAGWAAKVFPKRVIAGGGGGSTVQDCPLGLHDLRSWLEERTPGVNAAEASCLTKLLTAPPGGAAVEAVMCPREADAEVTRVVVWCACKTLSFSAAFSTEHLLAKGPGLAYRKAGFVIAGGDLHPSDGDGAATLELRTIACEGNDVAWGP